MLLIRFFPVTFELDRIRCVIILRLAAVTNLSGQVNNWSAGDAVENPTPLEVVFDVSCSCVLLVDSKQAASCRSFIDY